MKKTLFILALLYAAIVTAQDNRAFDFGSEYSIIGRLYNENKLDSAVFRLGQLEKNILALDNPFPSKEYVYTIFTLCDIYARQNKYKECERTIERAEYTLKTHGEQAYSQRKLLFIQKGQICFMLDNIDGAKDSFLQAKEVFEKEGDVSSVDYALCLNGLAMIFQKTGDYCFSNILLNQSVNIFQNVALEIGVNVANDSRYLTIWNNIAQNFQYMGDIENAENIREKILRIGENQNGGSNYFALVNTANTEIQKGNYDEAIDLIEKANVSDFGGIYKDNVYENLIISLYISNNNRVVDVLKHYVNDSKNNLSTIFSTYAESERERYWSNQSQILELVTNAVSWKYQTPELLKMAYNNTLYTKTLLMRFSKIISDFAKRSTNNEVKSKYTQLLNLKKDITQKGISADSVKAHKEKIIRLEREIISSVKNPIELFDYSLMSCDKVRQNLKRNEVAVEFLIIPEIFSSNEGEKYYGALIERPHFSHPIFVKLCKQDLFDDILEKHDMMENEFVDSLYSLNNEKLYNLIFQPLEKYLHNGETIYFSPVSGLHKVNLQAIAIGGNQRLMDRYVLVEVSSTAKIIENAARKGTVPLSNAFLIGGVDYNEGIEDMALEASYYSSFCSQSSVATRSTNRGTWDPIPETLFEAQQIDSILNKYNVCSVLLSGGKASEEAFKSLNGKSPEVIHLSTHGFFYEEKEDAATRYFDNTTSYAEKRLPMQFSGILLAGANNAWLGNQLPEYVEDGILTAEEISQMDLSSTEIAVLSACETGLGEIDDIDGVYGLQRGFKMAGVETIVMSLWKIPDDATKILMVEFYKNLMAGKSKHQSLIDAQSFLRSVENGKYDKPEYWASFIMLDGIN